MNRIPRQRWTASSDPKQSGLKRAKEAAKARMRSWLESPPRWGDAWLPTVLGLVLRVSVAVWAGERFPPANDGFFYHTFAVRIAQGEGYTWQWPDGVVTSAAHYPVGYPGVVGALYALGGALPVWAMLFNAVVGAAAVLAAHRIAATAASRLGAILAAWLVCLHPALIGYTPAVMTEGVVGALLAVAFWLTLLARGAGNRGGWVRCGLGVLLGLVTLTRPQSLLLAPLFGAYSVRSGPGFSPAQRWGRHVGAAVLTSLVAVLVCSPWTWRNCERMDRCVFVSANAGWNLLIGAAQKATGAWVPIEHLGVPAECREVFGEVAKDACFWHAGVQEVRADPLRWLSMAPAKLGRTFDGCGAAGWYLHTSNGAEFGAAAQTGLDVLETLWQRGFVLLPALVALARWGRLRSPWWSGWLAVAGFFVFLRSAWVAYLALVLGALLLGRRLSRYPPAFGAAAAVATTALTHVVFFGAGRYSLVCFPLLAALSGCVLPRALPEPDPRFLGPRGHPSRF